MKLELEISGGFAPAITSGRYSLEVATLPEDIQKRVEELVKDLLAAPRSKTNPQLRDAMSYALTITSDGHEETVVADDGALSKPMTELIKLMKSAGTRTKRSM